MADVQSHASSRFVLTAVTIPKSAARPINRDPREERVIASEGAREGNQCEKKNERETFHVRRWAGPRIELSGRPSRSFAESNFGSDEGPTLLFDDASS